jgi:predicted O-linked N-acetylglucosamine transferase (SPINDLY family)
MAGGHSGGAAACGPSDAELAFQRALSLRRQGQGLLADEHCAQALQLDPAHFHAYHLRGLIALDHDETDRGIEFIEKSLAINPNQPLAYSNLGNALLSAGRPQEALDSLERALSLKSDLVIAHYNRGNALRSLSRFAQALASYDATLTLDNAHVKALNNRGLVLQELGRFTEALSSFDRASKLDPRFAASQANLAAVLLKLDRPLEALATTERLLRWTPEDPEAHRGRADALLALGRLDEAVDSYSKVLQLEPGNFDVLINRGTALQRQKRLEAALEDCERAVQSRPQSGLALGNTGNVLLGLDRARSALACYERALALSSDDSSALHGRGAALLKLGRLEEAAQAFAELLSIQPDHPSALGNLFHLRMEQCDWTDYETLSRRVFGSLKRTKRFVNPLSLLMYDDPEVSLACARTFAAETYPPEFSLGPFSPPAGSLATSTGGSKIRVAYVSADFCDHPVAHLLVGALERHDRERFEVIGVSLRARGGGPFEQRVHAAFDRCIDASSRSDREVAVLMREWGIDIAVDLMGFTEGSRLGIFAQRAAPVQVNYLGYAGTVGAPYMDYLLADGEVIPAGDEHWYGEQVVRLPHCYLPTDDRCTVGQPPTRAEAGLPQHGLVFCAFTKAHKIHPGMFGIWMRLLQKTEGSVLWLRGMGTAAQANLTRAAETFGVAGGRLVFAPRVASRAEHLGRQALADLVLDTLPYNAHSTTCDALWAGVPVLTCAGAGFASRVAASALAAAGLPELITRSLEEYERGALELAHQPERLEALRSRLALEGRRSPLFDTIRYTGDLEAAYAQMHERAVRGEAPVAFAVDRSLQP